MKDLLNKIHHADCLEFMKQLPDKCIDLVLTDPPYPDYYAKEYDYNEEPIKYLDKFKCKQLIFWTAKEDFILDYSAIHIWDKKVGCGSFQERIFERNGGKNYKVYNQYLINSTVAAKFNGEVFYNHPSQKPLKLITKLIEENSKEGDTILDCFSGSGTTAIACHNLKMNFICVEKDKDYYEASVKRLEEHKKQLSIFDII